MKYIFGIFILFLSVPVFAQYDPYPNKPSNPYVKDQRPGRSGTRGLLKTVKPGTVKVDIYGNVYQRVSERLGFINGRLQYRTVNGWVTPDQRPGFLHDKDYTRRFNPRNYTLRFAGESPRDQAARVKAMKDYKRQSLENVQRYRNSLPPQYNRLPYGRNGSQIPPTGRTPEGYRRAAVHGQTPAQYQKHPVYGSGR